MDRSMDSIGSCSLDIDADSTDFSTDTSESLNFLSPSSTREDFTAGIAERCRKLQHPQPLTPKLILNQPINRKSNTSTAYFDIESGKINTIVSRANGGEINGSRYFNGNSSGDSYLSTKTIELASPTVVAHANKKPSYLNLACCVNGYSNYTTYDSQERKDINKSREVSPIRPIINSLSMSRQQRSNDNLLVPNTSTTTSFVKTSPLASITTRFSGLNMNGDKDTTDNAGMNGSASVDSKLGNRKSFIQQRVEKLYGLNSSSKIITTVKSTDSLLSNGNGHAHNGNGTVIEEKENDEDSVNSLPVMKHLRPEFAKQLKFCNASPKKSSFKLNGINGQNGNLNSDISAATVVTSNVNISLQQQTNTENLLSNAKLQSELESKEPVVVANIMDSDLEKENVPMAVVNGNGTINNGINKIEAVECSSAQGETKDGHYFLQLLIIERNRILKMADDMEKDMELAHADPSIELSEDMIGLLLAAIGKSRLLATKKFKQFEGLCQTNLNPNKEEAFETRAGDLQGFWDMMLLQVDNVDASHEEILQCKKNGWEKPQAPSPSPPKGSRMTKRPLTQSTKSKTTVPVKKPSTTSVNPAAALKREEQRKKLMEMKRKQKATIQNSDELVVVIGSNENNGSGECENTKTDLEIFL